MKKVLSYLKNIKRNTKDSFSKGIVNKVFSFIRHRLIGFNFTDGIIFKTSVYIILIAISYVYIFPLARMVSLSFMSFNDMLNPAIKWISKNPTLENFIIASRVLNIPSFSLDAFSSWNKFISWIVAWGKSAVWNSIWFSLLLALAQTVVSAFAGYAFARYDFSFKKFWMSMLLLSFVIPIPLLMIPRILMFIRFQDILGIKMFGSVKPQLLLALFGQGVFSTVLILIFTNFFKLIPIVLDEAARIDGASTWQVFYHIIIKMSASTITIVLLFSFVWNWNDTYSSGTFYSGLALLPRQLGAFSYLFGREMITTPDGEKISLGETYQMAATFISIVPLLIVYAFAQKRFIQGIEQTGITGE